MTGLLAYRFALDPTPAPERALRSHAGAARVAFNWGLARVKAVMDQRAANHLRNHRRRPDACTVLVAVLAAQRLERRQGHDRYARLRGRCGLGVASTGTRQLRAVLSIVVASCRSLAALPDSCPGRAPASSGTLAPSGAREASRTIA